MRIAFDELVPEGEEVACVAVAPTLHDARRMKGILEEAHIDFAVECEPHASFQLASHEHPRAAFFVAASDAARAIAALHGAAAAPVAAPAPVVAPAPSPSEAPLAAHA
jgi:hypothetical protein